MNKLALGALFVGLAACGGGDGTNPDVVVTIDAPGQTTCNPLMQTGCNAGEKCTWWTDQENPPIGHVGCAPDGNIPIGQACTDPVAGPMGYDQCAKGGVCLSGVCKQICSLDAGSPACDANSVCTRYADFFEVSDTAVAGVCDPSCDPLTQELKAGSPTAACGSTNPAQPNSGCFGFDEFSCAPTGMSRWEKVDRVPAADANGTVYLNGCAPGFMPIFREETGSNVTVCTGLCAAVDVFNGTQNAATLVKGDATALAKLPTEPAPLAGNATCEQGKKGGDGSSECVYAWPYLLDDTTGELLPSFETLYADKLGFCLALSKYPGDYDNDPATMDTLPPSCASLDMTEALNNGCFKFSATPAMAAPTAKRIKTVRVPTSLEVDLVRHRFN